MRSVGHRGKFGHEFMEFEFNPDGRLRYANDSKYKNDVIIRKEAFVSKAVLDEVKRIVESSEVMKCGHGGGGGGGGARTSLSRARAQGGRPRVAGARRGRQTGA